jgi:hypothetical protein
MRDARQYWKETRELAEGLPEFVWLTSLQGARVVETKALQAAQLLLAKTHRVATEQEVAQLRAEEGAHNRQAANEELKRQGIAVVCVERD